jgi:hypothetical protein
MPEGELRAPHGSGVVLLDELVAADEQCARRSFVSLPDARWARNLSAWGSRRAGGIGDVVDDGEVTMTTTELGRDARAVASAARY